MENEKVEIARFKLDRKTKEEVLEPLFLYKNDVSCLYKDSRGVFVYIKQGYYFKVPYKLSELEEKLEL